MIRYLKQEYKINASHQNMGDVSNIHFHTFVITIKTNYLERDLENILSREMNSFLERFTGMNLSQMDYFDGVYPSIEEIGDRFYESMKVILETYGITLYELGISDSHMATYYVSDRIMLPILNDNIGNKNYDLVTKLLDRV